MEEEGFWQRETGWAWVVKIVLVVIGILTVLTLIIINCILTGTQMHGCEGRPEIAIHLFLVQFSVASVFWYIVADGVKYPNIAALRHAYILGYSLGLDTDSYEQLVRITYIVLCVFGLGGGTVMGWYMVYSIAIIPRGCTVPPSMLARVYYWTVGGVFGLLGIVCLAITVKIIRHAIYKECKRISKSGKDNRQAKRLLQTVNRASLGAQSRVTVLYEDIIAILVASSSDSNTYRIANKMFKENILNLCTVYASDICDTDLELSMLCSTCKKKLQPTDPVVVLYTDSEVTHLDCFPMDKYHSQGYIDVETISALKAEVPLCG